MFGPNGASKSVFAEALDFSISSTDNAQECEKIVVTPFKFYVNWRKGQSEFEAAFIHECILYQYRFVVDENRVL